MGHLMVYLAPERLLEVVLKFSLSWIQRGLSQMSEVLQAEIPQPEILVAVPKTWHG